MSCCTKQTAPTRYAKPCGTQGEVINIKGDQGEKGCPGPEGPIGPEGPQGETGLSGEVGAMGPVL